MADTRSLSIRKEIYNSLKAYCEANGMKVIDVAGRFIHDGLMNEMYGDIPFGKVDNGLMSSDKKEVEVITVNTNENKTIVEEENKEVIETIIEDIKPVQEETVQKINKKPRKRILK